MMTLLDAAHHDGTLPRPTWDEFMRMFLPKWEPGEHVFVYGETGSGKSELAYNLLNARPYGVAFITKPRDPILKSPLTRGYHKVYEWPPKSVDSVRNHHFLLMAKASKTVDDEVISQREMIPDALDRIYVDGGWNVMFDETLHLTEELQMGSKLSRFAYLARSNNLTGIYCSQRPARIPTIIPQSCKWAFIARSRREADIATLSELGYSRAELKRELSKLRSLHDFLFIDPQGDLPMMIVNTHA